MLNKLRTKLPLPGAVALALLSAAAVLYYLLWPARGTFFADTTDTLYWAQASFDSGRLADPDFAYATLLPFGGSLLMLPFFGAFGMSMTTHLIGMTLFAVLFMLALWFFCTGLPMGTPGRLLMFSAVLMALSASGKLREIMWEHVIYYSLGIWFALMMMGVLFRLIFGRRDVRAAPGVAGFSRRHWVWLGILFILSVLCGLDGPQVVVFCGLPVGVAVAAERFFSGDARLLEKENRPAFLAAAVLLGGSVIGVVAAKLMWGGVDTVYSDSYMVFSPPGSWAEHVLGIAESWVTLLGVTVVGGESLVSLRAVMELGRLAMAALLFFLPLCAVFWYKSIRSRRLHILLWYHWVLTAITLGSHVFGRTYDTNWRMTPMVASAVIVTVGILHQGWQRGGQLWVLRRVVAFGAAVVALYCTVSFVGIARMAPNQGLDGKLYQVTEVLEQHGLTHGFSGFETAHSVTVLSEERVKARLVDITAEGVTPRMYQTRAGWYDEESPDGRYFLIASHEIMESLEGKPAWEGLEQHELERIHCGEFLIMVYDINIVSK